MLDQSLASGKHLCQPVNMDHEPAPLTATQCLARKVRQLRTDRGWSAQKVADLLAEIYDGDPPMDRPAIANLENGRRKAVTIEEFIALSVVFNVPPPLMLLPLGTEDVVEITPQSRIHPHLAVEWFAGDEPLASTSRFAIGLGSWADNAEPLFMYRTLRDLQGHLSDTERRLDRAEHIGDEGGTLTAKRERADAIGDLHTHLLRMTAAGVRPPGQTADMLAEMAAFGLDTSDLRKWIPDAADGES